VWYVCSSSACTYTTVLQTHLPLASAYDPVTDITVFATIKTDRNSGAFGFVKIHPGLNGTSNNHLEPGSWKPSGNLPTRDPAPSLFPYDGTTDTGVGLACAKPGTGVVAYNCLLAWVDRGGLNNAILYRYFRLNPGVSGGVEWHSSTYRLSGAFSASNVSAAYFDQKFWLTFRNDTGNVVVMRTPSTSYSSWSTATTTNSGDVVDPPTFLYDADVDTLVNAVVTWTEHP